MPATMAPPTIYRQLKSKCLKLMTHFQTDLLVHDRRSIREHKNTPFLHWTRKLGTDICFLIPPREYPPKGKSVPFLFGTADRERLLENVLLYAQCHIGRSASEQLAVHHFDGQHLRSITCEVAIEIVRDYARQVEHAWQHPARN